MRIKEEIVELRRALEETGGEAAIGTLGELPVDDVPIHPFMGPDAELRRGEQIGGGWWAALLAQAQANHDLAAALLRVVPRQDDVGVCPPDKLEVWYADQDATEGNVAAAKVAQGGTLVGRAGGGPVSLLVCRRAHGRRCGG